MIKTKEKNHIEVKHFLRDKVATVIKLLCLTLIRIHFNDKQSG